MKVLQQISWAEEDETRNVFVEYQIRPDVMSPDTITSILGIQPTRSYAKGEEYLGKAYDPGVKKFIRELHKRPFNIWDFSSETVVNSKKVIDHLNYVLDIIEPKYERIQPFLANREEFYIRFYIRWEPIESHGSFTIPGETLIKMGKLCHFVETSFIYSSDNEE
jgi:hypothetical protein